MSENNLFLAEEWFKKANDDFAFAQHGFAEGFYSHVCFLCQQVCEKYLKGYLVFNGIDPPRTHSLTRLAGMCETIAPGFLEMVPAYDDLNIFYISSRYPASWPGLIISEEQARETLQIAEQTISLVRKLVYGK